MSNAELPQQAATLTVEQALQQGVAHHQAGRLQDAERFYRAILQAQPDHADANHNLGVLAVQSKQAAAGLANLKAALEAQPSQGQYWLSYIDALVQAGHVDAARQVLEQGRERGLQGEAIEAWAQRLAEPALQEKKTMATLFAEGRYAEAAAFARAMTESFPLYVDGWKVLGAALQRMGRIGDALLPMQRAAELSPDDAETHNNLGVILKAQGRLDEAEASYLKALQIKPDYAEAHSNLGNALKELGRLEAALTSHQRALQIDPDYAKAHNNLGAILKDLGRMSEAEASCRRALEIDPDLAEAYNNLGVILRHLGRMSEAEANCRRALELDPDYAEAHSNLGAILGDLSRPFEAEVSCRRALEINPDLAEAHNNLGGILSDLSRPLEAEASYRRALELDPDYAEAHSNLGAVLNDLSRQLEAEAVCRTALIIKPDFAEAHSNLGAILKELGRLEEAEASLRRAVEIKPDYVEAHDNLLYLLNCRHDKKPLADLAEAKRYGESVRRKVRSRYVEWLCARSPERLRVGLVSGDMRNHPVGYFLESFVGQLDPAVIELIGYPTYHKEDELTTRIRPYFAAWRPLFGQSDEAAARMIHEDGIHVLLDVSGHTGHNRLPVFAWKPAPVQASWLGYFATTGVGEIDYVLGDRYVTPLKEADHFTEKIWQLPDSYWCLGKPDACVEVGPLPALSAGHITFGCFNNLSKMNAAVVALWSRVLVEVPGSKLFLKAKQLNEMRTREATMQRFAEHGIGADRLILEGSSPRAEYLAAYHRVDIALDPFPYPGATTSLEGLWMGVPVITRCGDRYLSHVGETIAHNAGLSGWIAADEEDYIAKAVAYAGDVEGLAVLRAGLRRQVLSSPLFDAPRFARNFEKAMWGMWNRFAVSYS